MSRFDLEFTPQGPAAPLTGEVRQSILERWQQAFGRELNPDERTPQGQLITTETAIVQDKNNQLLYLANQFNPETAEGVYQDALGRIYFLDRHPARATVVMCRCMGLAGTIIRGTDVAEDPMLAQDADGRMLACSRTDAIPASGEIVLPFACLEPGPIVIAARRITVIVRGPGVDAIDNDDPGVTGRHAESRAEFEQRRRDSVAKNARSVLGAVFAEVSNLPGVLDCFCRQNRTPAPVTEGGVTLGPHSIYVAALGGEDAAIAQAIYNKNSAGSDYNGNTAHTYTDPETGAVETVRFHRPDLLRIQMQVTIMAGSMALEERIKRAALDDFHGLSDTHVSGRARIGGTLFASRFYCPVLGTGARLISIRLASYPVPAWVESVTASWTQVPSLEEDDIMVIHA